MRIMIAVVHKAYPVQCFKSFLFSMRLIDPAGRDQPFRYILQRVFVQKKVEILENKTRVQTVSTDLRTGHPVHFVRDTLKGQCTLVRDLKKIQTAQQRCFSGTGRSQNNGRIPRADRKIDPFQDIHAPEPFSDIFRIQQHPQASFTI